MRQCRSTEERRRAGRVFCRAGGQEPRDISTTKKKKRKENSSQTEEEEEEEPAHKSLPGEGEEQWGGGVTAACCCLSECIVFQPVQTLSQLNMSQDLCGGRLSS